MDNGVKDAPSAPLTAIVESFEGLAKLIGSWKQDSSQELRLDTLCDACSLVSVLFGSLGLAFKFAELEYVSKVRDLVEASKTYETLHTVLDVDVGNDTVKTPGSHSRNLRRVRQGLDLVRALFEQFLSTEFFTFGPSVLNNGAGVFYRSRLDFMINYGLACAFFRSDYSLKEAASTAYAQVCAPYHTWTVRTAVTAGMYTLPTREQLLLKLNETNQSAEKKMRRYINASVPVIEYIDKLYISRNISLDW